MAESRDDNLDRIWLAWLVIGGPAAFSLVWHLSYLGLRQGVLAYDWQFPLWCVTWMLFSAVALFGLKHLLEEFPACCLPAATVTYSIALAVLMFFVGGAISCFNGDCF
jgi:hypothetical protein